MYIGIDATPISIDGKGLSRFLVGLVKAFARHSPNHHFVIFVNINNQLPELPIGHHIEYVKVNMRNTFHWDLIVLPKLLSKYELDFLISCSDRLPLTSNCPMMLYLFEIPHCRHRLGGRHLTMYAKISVKITEWWFPLSLRRSGFIITSSKATSESLHIFGISSNKTQIIFPGLDEKFGRITKEMLTSPSKCSMDLPKRYILHFSSKNDPRDNTTMAIKAFHRSKLIFPHDYKLVIAGKADPTAQELDNLINDLDLMQEIVWAGYIPEDELIAVYLNADLYLDPSLYEGFGYQVAEAMACGVPIVCSNVTSLPELVENAAITADPYDVDSLANGIVQVLSSSELSATLHIRGLQQVEKLSWEKLVGEMLFIGENHLCG